MIARFGAAAFLTVAILGLSIPPAFAEGIVVDGTSVEATESDGSFVAKIDLFNTGESDVTLPEEVALTDSCNAKVSDRTVGGLRSGSVTLTFDEACFGDADSVEADLDAGGPLPAVTVKRPDDDHDWLPMGISAAIALMVAFFVGVAGVALMENVDAERKARNNPSSQNSAKRRYSYERLKARVNERYDLLTPPETLRWVPALPAPDDYGLTSEVKGLEAGWSFKDSWAANLTVATTAFVALINSSETLTAVLGEEPKAALGVMTVAGLVSAVLIAVANTVAKLVGDSPSKVTTGGLILSTSLVVFAAGLQIGTVGGTALTLVQGGPAKAVVIGLTVGVGAVLVWYAVASMRSTLEAGAPDPPMPAIPPDAVEAWTATEDWERALVRDRIQTTYADWLTTPPPPLAVPAYPALPMMVMPTSRGDDPYRPVRASLI